jgi:hypothetical protein
MLLQNRFIKACSEGHLEKVEKMLNNKYLTFLRLINIDRYKKYGATPLIAAIKSGHVPIVKILLESGVDVNYGSKWSTPLIEASGNGSIEIVKLLIAAGADINLSNRDYTPLLAACRSGYFEIAAILIDSGADLTAKDYEGETAIMHAAKRCKDYLQFKELAKIFFSAVKDGDKITEPAINKLWQDIDSFYKRKEMIERSRVSSKGSIGHDRLNVKTYRRTEWKNRLLLLNQNIGSTKSLHTLEKIDLP